jgi:hypothetical protein
LYEKYRQKEPVLDGKIKIPLPAARQRRSKKRKVHRIFWNLATGSGTQGTGLDMINKKTVISYWNGKENDGFVVRTSYIGQAKWEEFRAEREWEK